MKLLSEAFKKLFFIVLSITTPMVYAGNYPFPQNVDYAYGIKPSAFTYTHALSAYKSWKEDYYEEVEGTNRGRVIFREDTRETVSEGIAYGMLLSVYADDKDVFDRLWNYYRHHENSRGVMNWKIDSLGNVSTIGSNGYNGATDAEEDAAMALVVAHSQWGSEGVIDYLEDAKRLINTMMEHEVEKPSYILKPGDAWGGSDVTNPSYFAPAYYRIYYQITGDDQWIKVLDKCYEILDLNSDPETGLVSDWCNGQGKPVSGMGYNYTYDASRFPWRMAVDYLWFGDQRAQEYCLKMSDFVAGLGGSKNINGSGYQLDGTPLGGGHNPVFVATFATAVMGTGQEYQSQLNSAYSDAVITKADEYFAATLRAISLFVLTGNFYRMPEPVCSEPELGEDLSLCVEPSYTLSAGIESTGFNYLWSTGETTPGITVNQPAEYWVRADSAGCVKYDTVNVTKVQADLGEDITMSVFGTELSVYQSGPEFSYLWSTNEISQSIQVSEEGVYWVEVDSLGCRDRDSINVYFGEADSLKVYPNPSNGIVNVMIFDPHAKKAEVEVFNERGQWVKSFKKNDFDRGVPLEADLTNQPAGYYYFRIRVDETKHTRRILIR